MGNFNLFLVLDILLSAVKKNEKACIQIDKMFFLQFVLHFASSSFCGQLAGHLSGSQTYSLNKKDD